MDKDLRQSILRANTDLHRGEAELYDRIHPELSNDDEKARLSRLLDAAQKGLPASSLRFALDIGAGTGFVTAQLLERGFVVQAVDISPEMLGILSAKFPSEIRDGRVAVSAMDADSYLDESREAFSVITVSSVLHHLPDYAATLDILSRRLVPGGALVVFHEPAGGELSGFEKFLQTIDWRIAWNFQLSKADKESIKSKKLDYGMADYHVTHGFDEGKVMAALDSAGLTVEKFEDYATAKSGSVRRILSFIGIKRTWCLVARRLLVES
jgi:SAM-dependent methyltransferase